MEQHLFKILVLIVYGVTEKPLQFKIPLKLSYIKNVWFNDQKCIFGQSWQFEMLHNLYVYSFINLK